MIVKAKELEVGDIITDEAYPEGPIKILKIRTDSFAIRIDGMRLTDGEEVWHMMGVEADIEVMKAKYDAGGELP